MTRAAWGPPKVAKLGFAPAQRLQTPPLTCPHVPKLMPKTKSWPLTFHATIPLRGWLGGAAQTEEQIEGTGILCSFVVLCVQGRERKGT